jgi:hypothetical protein
MDCGVWISDKNPTGSRQQLAPQIHPISDETHHKIHALLTGRQKELEKAVGNATIRVKKTGALLP